MIKKIIYCADIHIRNFKRIDEYQEQLQKFVDECKEYQSKYKEDEVRIVIAGDLLHNKLDISGEGYVLASWFLKQLDNISKTIVIGGNHDVNMGNLSRIDPLTAIFSMCNFKQTYYLDKELNYESGCMIDDNVVWCLFSTFNNFARPNIEETRIENPDKTFIGLFHGEIKSVKTDAGYTSEHGLEASHFDGLDFCICGHIHKRQKISYNGIPLVYAGSLIQQDHGENISGHGYIILDADSLTYEEKNLPNPNRGFFTFSINSEEDIDNDIEQIINF